MLHEQRQPCVLSDDRTCSAMNLVRPRSARRLYRSWLRYCMNRDDCTYWNDDFITFLTSLRDARTSPPLQLASLVAVVVSLVTTNTSRSASLRLSSTAEKGFYALIIALLGIFLSTPDWLYTKFVIDRFYDLENREFQPSVYESWTKYANMTVAPLSHQYWQDYFIDPLGRDNIPIIRDVTMTSYRLEMMLPTYIISIGKERRGETRRAEKDERTWKHDVGCCCFLLANIVLTPTTQPPM